MTAKEKTAWKKLYELGIKFDEKEPWKKMEVTNLFQICFAGEEPVYFSVYGKNNSECGFKLYFGNDGLNLLFGVFEMGEGKIDPRIIIPRETCFSMCTSEENEIPKQQLQTIQQLKLKFKKGKWLFFDCYEDGYLPFECTMEEVAVITKYLEKFLEGYDDFVNAKKKYPKNLSLYSYREENGIWKGDFTELPFTEFKIPREKASDILIHTLKRCKKNSQIWEMEELALCTPIPDENFKKPIIPNAIVVMDHKKDMVLNQGLSDPDNKETLLVDVLADAIKEFGIPKKILIDNPFVDAKIHDLCSSIGIKVEYGDVECCLYFLDGLESSMGNDQREEKLSEIFSEMEKNGVDIAQMKKDMSHMTEEQFTKKYVKEMAYVLENLFDNDDLSFGDDDFDDDDLPFGDDDFDDDDLPFGDDDFDDDDLPFGDDDFDDDDFDEDNEFVNYEFRNRKEKVQAIQDFFGRGKMFGDDFKDCDKAIDFDIPDVTWKTLLNQSSVEELRDMAEKMGALVDKKMTKTVLVNTIQGMYAKRHKNLYELLSTKELEFLRKAERKAISLDGITPIDCLSVTKNDLLHLLSLGLIEIEVEYECGEYVMYVSAIDEINWSHAR